MSNGSEQYCLRWNDFQDSLLSTLQDLRDEEDFVDVTLVCDGGEQIAAHKLILSACSDFFRALLKRNPAPNPVIVLWDMKVEDIKSILKFMYNGEVEIQQTHLNTFLGVAERLRVRGLCQSGDKSPAATRSAASTPAPATSSSASKRPSSPSSGRRRSQDNAKRAKESGGDDENVAIKEESLHEDSASPLPGSSSSQRPDVAEASGSRSAATRSRGGSEADLSDFSLPGPEGFDDPAALAPALMAGMTGRGMLDPATAKELWRRAALAQMSLSSSNSSPPSNPFLRGHSDHSSPSEPPRRQRSVYTSQQIAQLEAYFSLNEYIDGERKRQLSQITNIPEQQIKVWFQNRRQKKKREQEDQGGSSGSGGNIGGLGFNAPPGGLGGPDHPMD